MRPRAGRGYTLLEVVVAMAVTFGVLFGILVWMLGTVRSSATALESAVSAREAGFLEEALEADLRSARPCREDGTGPVLEHLDQTSLGVYADDDGDGVADLVVWDFSGGSASRGVSAGDGVTCPPPPPSDWVAVTRQAAAVDASTPIVAGLVDGVEQPPPGPCSDPADCRFDAVRVRLKVAKQASGASYPVDLVVDLPTSSSRLFSYGYASAAPPPTPDYGDVVEALGPTAYWPLDELGGTTAADAMGSRPGEYRNGVVLGVPGVTRGGYAVQLDGVDDYVDVSLSSAPLQGGVDGTVAFWAAIDPTAASEMKVFGNEFGHMPAIRLNPVNRNGWATWVNEGFSASQWPSFTTWSSASGTLPIGEWFHLAFTYDKDTGELALYFDGQKVKSRIVDPAYRTGVRSLGTSLGLGWGYRFTPPLKGYLDEPAVWWGKALTPDDVAALASAASPPTPYREAVLATGPRGYWKLGEISGTTAFDSSGNGYNGSYMGTPALAQPGAPLVDLDKAAGFGAGDYVALPNIGIPNTSPVSVAAWINLHGTSPGAAYGVVEVTQQWRLMTGYGLPSPGNVQFRFDFRVEGTSATFRGVQTQLMPTGDWFFLVAVHDPQAGRLRLYVNGVLAQETTTFDTRAPGGGYQIARRDGTTWPDAISPTVDEVAIWDRPLSDQEVSYLYSAAGR